MNIRRWTGLAFIVGAVVINIPYTLLIMNFNYPDILREPAPDILTQFADGGNGLIWTWFAFAWTGLPLLLGIILLPRVIEGRSVLVQVATTLGVISGLAQMIGLLRWVFVVPVLAQMYTAPEATEASRAATIAVFQAVHQFGGVLIGEHIGQLFIIGWMALLSVHMLRSPQFRILGLVASGVFLLAQAELFATVMPSVSAIGDTGLYGSLLWLLWMMVLGVALMRLKPAPIGVMNNA